MLEKNQSILMIRKIPLHKQNSTKFLIIGTILVVVIFSFSGSGSPLSIFLAGEDSSDYFYHSDFSTYNGSCSTTTTAEGTTQTGDACNNPQILDDIYFILKLLGLDVHPILLILLIAICTV